MPHYNEFIEHVTEFADVQFLIIGRDENITTLQQERVRGKHTTSIFIKELDNIIFNYRTIFVSQELLYLYKMHYLNWLEREIGLLQTELTSNDNSLSKILVKNSNTKYISQAKSELDKTIKLASSYKGAL